MKVEIRPGQSFPLGATLYPSGVNFSVYSKNATGMDLLLFDEVSDPKPMHIIILDSEAGEARNPVPNTAADLG
jgi:glycogen operon protein